MSIFKKKKNATAILCGVTIDIASGDALDRIAKIHGIERRKYWIFKESDNRLRRRIINHSYAHIKNIRGRIHK